MFYGILATGNFRRLYRRILSWHIKTQRLSTIENYVENITVPFSPENPSVEMLFPLLLPYYFITTFPRLRRPSLLTTVALAESHRCRDRPTNHCLRTALPTLATSFAVKIEDVLWCMLFADDIIHVDTTREGVEVLDLLQWNIRLERVALDDLVIQNDSLPMTRNMTQWRKRGCLDLRRNLFLPAPIEPEDFKNSSNKRISEIRIYYEKAKFYVYGGFHFCEIWFCILGRLAGPLEIGSEMSIYVIRKFDNTLSCMNIFHIKGNSDLTLSNKEHNSTNSSGDYEQSISRGGTLLL
ncbi:hypothetical protein IEQ34_005374 [Dendrobium chrysotoxum]|uniref:Reverse transcriptase domain-containing protein n=1 Tax=Dendrobium chrysotoxum TaxID=161865 RepID=A0AAV7H7Z0_DENCH|nr:hypothetical protein IEQ34_005374 [Dendrobium chrysotoxum]